ncbi:MAG: hypothetical protein JJU20_12675 [Opitutales bacterium]|nr:hypothetical protein [Opitutales bacterium]
MKFTLVPMLLLSAAVVTAQEGTAPQSQAPEFTPEPILSLKRIDTETPQTAASRPLNLARPGIVSDAQTYRLGDTEPRSASESKDTLIQSDKAEESHLDVGDNQVLMDLNGYFNINRFAFRSYGASGRVIVMGSETPLSLDSQRWQTLSQPTQFRPGQPIEVEFPYTSTRYVRVRFEVDTPGSITPFAISGEDTILQMNPLFLQNLDSASGESSQAASGNTVPFNFASSITGAQVSHISSGNMQRAQEMIDDDPSTYFEFDGTERENVMVLDLRNSYRVSRFSMVMEAGRGRLQIYNLPTIPENMEIEGPDGERTLALPASFFETTPPLMQRIFTEPSDRVQIDFPETELRWVLIRWTPPEAEDGDDTPMISTLRVYEISVIGQVPEQFAAMSFIPRAQFLSNNPELGAVLPGPSTRLSSPLTLSPATDSPPPPIPQISPVSP